MEAVTTAVTVLYRENSYVNFQALQWGMHLITTHSFPRLAVLFNYAPPYLHILSANVSEHCQKEIRTICFLGLATIQPKPTPNPNPTDPATNQRPHPTQTQPILRPTKPESKSNQSCNQPKAKAGFCGLTVADGFFVFSSKNQILFF